MNISQTNAKAACTALGTGYHLITNNEWMTVARNIENENANWSGGVVGTGELNRGHTDEVPQNALAANMHDDQACEGTGQSCSNTVWSDQRRTHVLSTGEVIWDFAGNVWEWVDWNVVTDKASPQDAWIEINTASPTVAMPSASFYPEHTTYTTMQGIGAYYPSLDGGGGAAVRGGCWQEYRNGGVFTLALTPDSWSQYMHIGFRCAWSAGGYPVLPLRMPEGLANSFRDPFCELLEL